MREQIASIPIKDLTNDEWSRLFVVSKEAILKLASEALEITYAEAGALSQQQLYRRLVPQGERLLFKFPFNMETRGAVFREADDRESPSSSFALTALSLRSGEHLKLNFPKCRSQPMSKGNVTLPADIVVAVSKMTQIIGEEFTSSTDDSYDWQGPNDDWIVSLSWGGAKFKISVHHGFENPLDDTIMYALVGYAAYRNWEWDAP